MIAVDPTAEIEAYVQRKQIALGRSLASRKRVYLDLNFWIVARDTALGLRTDALALKLLHLLRRGVGQGRLFCPIGDSVFMELFKQPYSDDRRLGTAKMVDELSLGVALAPSQRRIGPGVYRLFEGLRGGADPLRPRQELIWTKVCHVLGPTYPVDDRFAPEVMLKLQQGFIDRLWEASLTDMITQAGPEAERAEDYGPLTTETNKKRDQHSDEMTSYEVAYETELRGMIEACEDLAANVLRDFGERAGFGEAPRSEDRRVLRNAACNMLLRAFEKRNAAATVRTLHVETALHASLSFDKKRRFKPNDWHDFRHAAAALSYCDLFLTERPLHELIARPHLGLLAINDCQVASTVNDAVSLLRSTP